MSTVPDVSARAASATGGTVPATGESGSASGGPASGTSASGGPASGGPASGGPASGGPATDQLNIAVRHRLSRIELDVSLSVGRETLALVGPSGAGKTSVLRAVAGLFKPDHALVTLHGRTLTDTQRHVNLPPESRHVGLMFQDGALFPT